MKKLILIIASLCVIIITGCANGEKDGESAYEEYWSNQHYALYEMDLLYIDVVGKLNTEKGKSHKEEIDKMTTLKEKMDAQKVPTLKNGEANRLLDEMNKGYKQQAQLIIDLAKAFDEYFSGESDQSVMDLSNMTNEMSQTKRDLYESHQKIEQLLSEK
jgi:hypothetical protein